MKQFQLFDIPVRPEKQAEEQKSAPKIKLKKGETIDTLIETARKMVDEKLGNYKDVSICVEDTDTLIKFFNDTDDGGIIGIDTETTGLNTFTDELVGISICNGKQALYIPITHKSAVTGNIISTQIKSDAIKEIFGRMFKERTFKWVYHNAKFDLAVLRTYFGYPVPAPYWDTMLCAYLFNQDEEHNLKYLFNKYIATEDEGINRFDTLFKGITFDYVPIDVATVYAGKDALMTFELYEYQKRELERPEYKGLKYVLEEIELPLLPILEDMQRTGVNMNQGMLDDLYKKYSARLEKAEKEVYAEINKHESAIHKFRTEHYDKKLDDPILISSPSQLSILFYEILGYKTKSGKGTGVAELEEIGTPLTKSLLEYRKMEKLIDAFLIALPKRIEPSTKKIHTSLNQYGAATGRFSSSSPNLQQIPSRGEAKEIRRIFGASKGNILMSSDFSQQEPRILAHMCGDENLIHTYATGKDLYSTMASQAFHTTYEECLEFYLDENGKKTDRTNPEGKKRRSNIKGVLLGIMYGRGTASVAEVIHSTVEEAQTIIDDFFKAYPLIKTFVEEKQKEAKQRGYTETAWGRRRYLKHIQDDPYEYRYNDNRKVDFNPLFTAKSVVDREVSAEIKDSYNSMLEKANFYKRNKIIEQASQDGVTILNNQGFIAEANRQVVNSIIQGSAADMTKRAMLLMGNNQELKDLGFKMLFPVHDELIAECPFENRKRCGELMSQLMIQAGAEKISVPMKCDVEFFQYWYGPDVSAEDDAVTEMQYKDYNEKGIYYEREHYEELLSGGV
jgi:DNA polymerase I-like protein with 3'-5' exonuclease and polymerase domains